MNAAAYKHYVLATLTLVYTLNYLDRGLMILLLQPIKDDLRLSDTQLGFLTGIAFGLFYAVLGLPVARLADRGNRVTIASIAVALWGATVMCCVLVTSFVQLVLARIAAAVGEAGCMPPTYSLIGDYFPGPAERTRALTIYALAGPLAALLSFVIGSQLNAAYGWRATFFLMGVPALFAAVLVRITVAEPRARRAPLPGSTSTNPRMKDVLHTLWAQRASRHLIIALILVFTLGLGLAPWYAAFLTRSHGKAPMELGLWLAAIFCVGGLAGILSGGYAAARWFADDEQSQMRLSAVTMALLVPCFAGFLLLHRKAHALIALSALIVISNCFLGPTFALMQRLAGEAMRATSLAVVMLLANLIGMGIGPQLVGVLSDRLQPLMGTDSLRYAMLIMSLLAFWAAWHFWEAGRTMREDLRTAGAHND